MDHQNSSFTSLRTKKKRANLFLNPNFFILGRCSGRFLNRGGGGGGGGGCQAAAAATTHPSHLGGKSRVIVIAMKLMTFTVPRQNLPFVGWVHFEDGHIGLGRNEAKRQWTQK